MTTPWKFTIAAAGGLLLASHAQAGEDISFEQASLLAASCFACHGTDGRMGNGIAPLAGRSFDQLREVLAAFRDDSVPNTTVMNRITAGYSDAELDAIALYFSGLSADGGSN